MKHCRLLLLLVLLACTHTPAFSLELGYGVKGGVAWSNFATKGEIEDIFLPHKSSRTGLSAGPFCSLGINRWLSAQVEVLYTQKGTRSWEYFTSGSGAVDSSRKLKYEYNLSYLDLPILGKVYPLKSRVYRPYLIAGPAFSIKLDAKYRIKFEAMNASADYSDVFKSVDYGLVAGGGLEYARFFVEVRSNFGLTHANDTAHEDWLTLKNRVLGVYGGYRF